MQQVGPRLVDYGEDVYLRVVIEEYGTFWLKQSENQLKVLANDVVWVITRSNIS